MSDGVQVGGNILQRNTARMQTRLAFNLLSLAIFNVNYSVNGKTGLDYESNYMELHSFF